MLCDKMKYVKLCGHGKCCPSVGLPTQNEKYVTIRDDYGVQIAMTTEQFKKLQKVKVDF